MPLGMIHDYTLRALGAASVNVEGRVQRGAPVDTVVRGRVDELSAREIELAAQRGQTHDIVCIAPLGTVVDDRMEVVVTEPARLAGTYVVDRVRTTTKHLRVLCSRTTIREPT